MSRGGGDVKTYKGKSAVMDEAGGHADDTCGPTNTRTEQAMLMGSLVTLIGALVSWMNPGGPVGVLAVAGGVALLGVGSIARSVCLFGR